MREGLSGYVLKDILNVIIYGAECAVKLFFDYQTSNANFHQDLKSTWQTFYCSLCLHGSGGSNNSKICFVDFTGEQISSIWIWFVDFIGEQISSI